MKMRSLLFVPADSEKKLEKARDSAADVLIVDLEDSVAESRKGIGREFATNFLRQTGTTRRHKIFVRVNPLNSAHCMHDLAAVVGEGLDGVVLPKADGLDDVVRLGHCLAVLEARAGLTHGAVKILVVATETAAAMLNIGDYQLGHPRLVGLTWGAEDLSSALGAVSNREADGELSHAYLLARSMCLVGAGAAGVAPIDTLYADFRDEEGLVRDCAASRRRGFVGRIAIHPAQVDVINRCYSPSDEDLALAREVVEAFAAEPEAGTVGLHGKMYDRPHLVQALRTLAAAEA